MLRPFNPSTSQAWRVSSPQLLPAAGPGLRFSPVKDNALDLLSVFLFTFFLGLLMLGGLWAHPATDLHSIYLRSNTRPQTRHLQVPHLPWYSRLQADVRPLSLAFLSPLPCCQSVSLLLPPLLTEQTLGVSPFGLFATEGGSHTLLVTEPAVMG